MAKWQRKIVLNPEWDQAQDHVITPQALASSIAVKLKALTPFTGDDDVVEDNKNDLVEQFTDFASDTSASQHDFNYLMSDLYDWADQPLDSEFGGKKACWIDTTTNIPAEA